MCAHFCYKMVHCGIFAKCIVGFVRWVYCPVPVKQPQQISINFVYNYYFTVFNLIIASSLTMPKKAIGTWKNMSDVVVISAAADGQATAADIADKVWLPHHKSMA